MKTMVALEAVIKDIEVRIAIAKGQLARHESGEEILTRLVKLSAENSLEEHEPLLEKYKKLFKELEKFEKNDCYEHRRLRSAILRKKYYKFNKIHNRKPPKKITTRENDERIEATMIVDELPEEELLNKQELYQFALQNMENYLGFDKKSETDLSKIQEEFARLIKGFTEENIKSLELLNYMIPIVIFHMHIFVKNFIEFKNSHVGEHINEKEFSFFPKYHDWWIEEIWESDIAYFSLFQWKEQVKELCEEKRLKDAWELIYSDWIFVKTLINEKSQLAFEYQYIFDSLVYQYVKLESELDINVIQKTKGEMALFIESEDFSKLLSKHRSITKYIKYKLEQKNK